MRRRIGGAHTGLGGGGSTLIDGKATKDKKINKIVTEAAKDAYETFFKGTKLDEEYCDAQYRPNEVRLGIEPSYMYESLKIIVIDIQKEYSYIETGYAWGAWGTGIRSTKRYYRDIKTNSKFKKFINKWHEKIPWKK